LYFKTSYNEHYFLELGRMNVKEGIAYGYNPTDYFKGGSSFTLSLDPKEKIENRLGAVLVQVSAIWDNITLKALYSPQISTNANSIQSDKKYIGLHLDESNSQERASLYLGYTGFDALSISGLLHKNDDGLNIGLNMSYIQERSIWYLEASTAKKQDKSNYETELSLGLNYSSQNNIVSTFEYIYNEGGLNKEEIHTLFSQKYLANYSPKIPKSTMLSKHTLFMMARQSDVLHNLDWNALAWVNPLDKSSLLQVGLSYEYEEIVFSLDARAYRGNAQTVYGSYPNEYEGLVSMSYYF